MYNPRDPFRRSCKTHFACLQFKDFDTMAITISVEQFAQMRRSAFGHQILSTTSLGLTTTLFGVLVHRSQI